MPKGISNDRLLLQIPLIIYERSSLLDRVIQYGTSTTIFRNNVCHINVQMGASYPALGLVPRIVLSKYIRKS